MPAWIDDGPGLTDVGIWEAPGGRWGRHRQIGGIGKFPFPKREAGLTGRGSLAWRAEGNGGGPE